MGFFRDRDFQFRARSKYPENPRDRDRDLKTSTKSRKIFYPKDRDFFVGWDITTKSHLWLVSLELKIILIVGFEKPGIGIITPNLNFNESKFLI